MTHQTTGHEHTDQAGPATAPSTTDVARDEAARVGRTGADEARHVAGTAAEQAGQVTQEARRQAADLYEQARTQAAEQASAGQHKAAESMRALAAELHQMADGGEQHGPASDLAAQAAGRIDAAADWLNGREPGDLIEEVRGFARRRPGTFLIGAALAGVVVGRLTRGAVDANRDTTQTRASAGPPRTAPPPVPPVPTPRPAYAAPTGLPADLPAGQHAAPPPVPHRGPVPGVAPGHPGYPPHPRPRPAGPTGPGGYPSPGGAQGSGGWRPVVPGAEPAGPPGPGGPAATPGYAPGGPGYPPPAPGSGPGPVPGAPGAPGAGPPVHELHSEASTVGEYVEELERGTTAPRAGDPPADGARGYGDDRR
jgi:hypothetical protein